MEAPCLNCLLLVQKLLFYSHFLHSDNHFWPFPAGNPILWVRNRIFMGPKIYVKLLLSVLDNLSCSGYQNTVWQPLRIQSVWKDRLKFSNWIISNLPNPLTQPEHSWFSCSDRLAIMLHQFLSKNPPDKLNCSNPYEKTMFFIQIGTFSLQTCFRAKSSKHFFFLYIPSSC